MSAEYVDNVIQSLRDDPRTGESVLVAVGVSGDPDAVAAAIEDIGGTVRKRLPYETIRVSIPERSLTALCRLDGVESVEAEQEIRPHDSGN